MGFVDFSDEIPIDSLHKMLDVINHDHNNVVSTYKEPQLAIGHADLTDKSEPRPYVDGKLVVFVHGEVVNKQELSLDYPSRYGNASVVAELYRRSGQEFIHLMKGHFVAAIWDRERQSLTLANDRFGRHNMYLWSPRRETLFFACEIAAIVPFLNKLTPNLQAVSDFLQFQFLFGAETYFKEISLLPYASVLHFCSDGTNLERYWSPKCVPVRACSEDAYVSKLHDLMSKALRREALGDGDRKRKVGIFLSGGLDTRNIAAHLPPLDRPVHAFTFGKPQDENVKFARRVACEKRFVHHFVPKTSQIIQSLGPVCMELVEGNSTLVDSQNMLVASEARRQGLDLLLSGDFGNTVFDLLTAACSFPLFVMLSIPHLGRLLLPIIKEDYAVGQRYTRMRDLLHGLREEKVLEILTPDCAKKIGPIVGESLRRAIREAPRNLTIFDLATFLYLTERRRTLTAAVVPCNSIIQVVDPILDYDIVDFMTAMPHDYKLQRGLVLKEMKANHASLMGIPLTGRFLSGWNVRDFFKMLFSRLPLFRRICEGPNRIDGYADLLREQEGFVRTMLLDPRTLSRGLLNEHRIEAFLDEHTKSRKDHTSIIVRLLSLELWFRSIEDRYRMDIFRFCPSGHATQDLQ
jgi:asparagine synthase (glutamine-hydrolysing)